MKFQKEDYWLGGLLLMAWVALNQRILFQGHSYILLDASSIFYHLWKWGGEVFRTGRIPLWCPDAALGTPYLADPTNAPLYPPKFFLYEWFDPTTAFTILLGGHSIWGLAGFWFLIRKKGFSPRIAFWGCLVFGFSFNAITLFWSPSMPLAMAWAPWVFFAFEKFWKAEEGAWLLLGTTLAFQWAAGYPIFGFMTVLLIALDCLLRLWDGERPSLRRKALAGAGSLAFAGLFNAVWMLPLAEFVPYSNLFRRKEMASSIDWRDWGTWLNPFFLGHPLFTPTAEFIFRVYFVGLPALVLLLHGFLTGRVARRNLLLLAGVIWMSLGETAFLGGWLKILIPGYGWVVRSGYWMPFVVMMTALASLEAVDHFHLEKKRGVDGLGAAIALLVYAGALIAGVPWALWSFWVSLGFLLLFFNHNRGQAARALFLCASLFFSMGPVDRAIFFTMPRSFYDDPPALAKVLTQPGRLYQAPDWVDGFEKVSGNGVAGVYDKIKENLVPDWPLSLGRPEVGYANTLFVESFLGWYYLPARTSARVSQKILDYLGVRYVMGLAAPQGVIPSGQGFWENRRACPLWFSTQRARLGEPLAAAKDSRFDPGKDVLVSSAELEGAYASRKVTEVFRSPNEIHLSAEGAGRALLASSEMNYPGWWGRVKGVRRPLATVNGIFRGTVLENGEAAVEIVYQPVTFRLGAFLSLLACAFWVGMTLKLRISSHA